MGWDYSTFRDLCKKDRSHSSVGDVFPLKSVKLKPNDFAVKYLIPLDLITLTLFYLINTN